MAVWFQGVKYWEFEYSFRAVLGGSQKLSRTFHEFLIEFRGVLSAF